MVGAAQLHAQVLKVCGWGHLLEILVILSGDYC
jgi:hypothetical protein